MTEYMRKRPLVKTAKLTDDQAREIISKADMGPTALAREYGVTPGAICYILSGKRKSLLPPEPLPASKVCTQCGRDKPLDGYYESPRSRDNRQSECKDCHKVVASRAAQRVPVELKMLRGAKYRAMSEGLPFEITLDDIVVPDRCPILGIELVRGEGQPTENSPSLDKIDPTMGYVPGNIQVISYRANAMKRDASAEELRRFAQWVLDTM